MKKNSNIFILQVWWHKSKVLKNWILSSRCSGRQGTMATAYSELGSLEPLTNNFKGISHTWYLAFSTWQSMVSGRGIVLCARLCQLNCFWNVSLKEAYTTLDFHVFFTYPISLVLVILLTTTSSLLSSYPSPLKPFCHMTLWVFDTTQWEFGFFLWSFSWNCIMPSAIM